eukprot:gene5331-8138_t
MSGSAPTPPDYDLPQASRFASLEQGSLAGAEDAAIATKIENETLFRQRAEHERQALLHEREAALVDTAKMEQAEIDRQYKRQQERMQEVWQREYDDRHAVESRTQMMRREREISEAEATFRSEMEREARFERKLIRDAEQTEWYESTRASAYYELHRELDVESRMRRQELDRLHQLDPDRQLSFSLEWMRNRKLWAEDLQSAVEGEAHNRDLLMQRETERVLAENRIKELERQALAIGRGMDPQRLPISHASPFRAHAGGHSARHPAALEAMGLVSPASLHSMGQLSQHPHNTTVSSFPSEFASDPANHPGAGDDSVFSPLKEFRGRGPSRADWAHPPHSPPLRPESLSDLAIEHARRDAEQEYNDAYSAKVHYDHIVAQGAGVGGHPIFDPASAGQLPHGLASQPAMTSDRSGLLRSGSILANPSQDALAAARSVHLSQDHGVMVSRGDTLPSGLDTQLLSAPHAPMPFPSRQGLPLPGDHHHSEAAAAAAAARLSLSRADVRFDHPGLEGVGGAPPFAASATVPVFSSRLSSPSPFHHAAVENAAFRHAHGLSTVSEAHGDCVLRDLQEEELRNSDVRLALRKATLAAIERQQVEQQALQQMSATEESVVQTNLAIAKQARLGMHSPDRFLDVASNAVHSTLAQPAGPVHVDPIRASALAAALAAATAALPLPLPLPLPSPHGGNLHVMPAPPPVRTGWAQSPVGPIVTSPTRISRSPGAAAASQPTHVPTLSPGRVAVVGSNPAAIAAYVQRVLEPCFNDIRPHPDASNFGQPLERLPENEKVIHSVMSEVRRLAEERDMEKAKVADLHKKLTSAQMHMDAVLQSVRNDHERQAQGQLTELQQRVAEMSHLKADRERAQRETEQLKGQLHRVVEDSHALRDELLSRSSMSTAFASQRLANMASTKASENKAAKSNLSQKSAGMLSGALRFENMSTGALEDQAALLKKLNTGHAERTGSVRRTGSVPKKPFPNTPRGRGMYTQEQPANSYLHHGLTDELARARERTDEVLRVTDPQR